MFPIFPPPPLAQTKKAPARVQITRGASSISVAENTTAVGTIAAVTTAAGTLVYSINGGADAALFSINSSSGALTFSSAPDYETPLDANIDNIYVVIVRATWDEESLTDDVTLFVTVTDVVSEYETPAYANAGGTGDRQALITITSTCTVLFGDSATLIDGITTGGIFFNEQTTTGLVIRFDFAHSVIIEEFRFYKSAAYELGFGNWKAQISNDGSSWSDVGTGFTLGAGAGTPITHALGNSASGRFFWILGTGGTMPAAEYYEFEFKIGNPL